MADSPAAVLEDTKQDSAPSEIVGPEPNTVLIFTAAGLMTWVALQPRAPAPGAAGQDVRMMEQTIQERGDGGGVAEELPPVLDGTIRRDQRGRFFVAPHDDLEEVLGGGVGQLAHGEIVDQEERDGRELREVGFPRAGELRIREFVEQHVGFAVTSTLDSREL